MEKSRIARSVSAVSTVDPMVRRSSPTFKTHARAILVEHFAERNRPFSRKYSARRNLI